MPRARGIWREQWKLCDRCAFIHPLSLLVRQKGLLLCTDHGCLDNLDVERRSFIISRVVSQPGEFENEEVKLNVHPGDLPIF